MLFARRRARWAARLCGLKASAGQHATCMRGMVALRPALTRQGGAPLPPQVILGAGYDDAADVWSLGCMVFELVTGDLL